MPDWFTQADVGGDVVRVAEPHVNELVSANLWWLRGNDRDIVIDAGLGVVALRAAIPAMFERDPMVVLTDAAGLDVPVVHPGHGRSFDSTRLHQLAGQYLRRTA